MGLRKRCEDWLRQQFEAVDVEAGALKRGGIPDEQTWVVIVTMALVLGFMQYVAREPGLQAWVADGLMLRFDLAQGLELHQIENRLAFMENLVWGVGSLVGYIVIPLATIKLVLRGRLADFGLRAAGYWRHFPIYMLLFLPVLLSVLLVSLTHGFQQTYPFYREPESVGALLAWEVLYGLQFLGLEVFFRGFLLHGLKARYGSAALWIMLMPYVMIHFTKPPLEAMGAVLAGLVLGLLSLRTRSIWGGVTIHVAVAWTMDAVVLWQTGWWAAH